jgi:hypothetical protein
MYESATTSFFDMPSVPELIRILYSLPQSLVREFGPAFAQILVFKLRLVYDHPIEFARAVHNFLRVDLSPCPFFAFSTFPGLYSHFIGAEFCDQGCQFLESFFEVSRSLVVSLSLLAAFFGAAPQFYAHFWPVLSERLAGVSKITRFEAFLGLLKEVLSLALCRLSRAHILALKNFDRYFPGETLAFLTDQMIGGPFKVASQSCTFLMDQQANALFIEFLATLKERPDDGAAFVAFVLSHDTFLDVNPTMSGPTWGHGVPILLSCRDLEILTDIFTGDEAIFSKGPQLKLPVLGHDLTTLVMTTYPVFCSDTMPPVAFTEGFFNMRPFPVEFESDDIHERVWRQVQRMMADSGDSDMFRFVQRAAIRDDDRIPIYLRILQAYFTNSRNLDYALMLAEHLQELAVLRCSIRNSTAGYFRRAGMPFLSTLIGTKRAPNAVTRLVQAIATVVTDVAVPRTALFEICSAALDAMPLPRLPSWELARGRFRAVLLDWGRIIWPEYQNAPMITRRLNLIIRTATLLGRLRGAATGQMLTIILDFTRDISVIVDDPGLWGIIFYFSIWIAQIDEILPIFLFFWYCIFPVEEIAGKWSAHVKREWEEFAHGMWQIVSNDAELNSLCTDRERTIAELFPGICYI